jgi:hypothetical protein
MVKIKMVKYICSKCEGDRRKIKCCGNDVISECLNCGHKEHLHDD